MKQIQYDLIKYKKVKGFPRYFVSEYAVIYDSLLNRCLRKYISKTGYEFVYLDKDRKQYTVNVHTIVASAWKENPEALPEINHDDFNKLNNYADNLTWVTKMQNITHAVNGDRYKKR